MIAALKGKKRAGKMQLLHECTNQHALKIDSSATKRKILQQQQVSYPSSCFAIHNWSQTLYKVVFESQYMYVPTILRDFFQIADFEMTVAWQPWHSCPSMAAVAWLL